MQIKKRDMKKTIHSTINVVIITVIIFLGVLLLFQLTYADQVSFSNDMIDHIMHFTSNVVVTTIILLLFIYMYSHAEKVSLKILLGTLVTITTFIWLIFLPFSSAIVFSSERTNERYYFTEAHGYQYYVVSERFVAFAGSPEIYFYKEKPRFYFIKERQRVTETELKTMGIDPYVIQDKFEEIHLRH